MIEAVEEVAEEFGMEVGSLFDMFNDFTSETKESPLFAMDLFASISSFNMLLSEYQADFSDADDKKKVKKKRKSKVYANCSLF